MIQMRCQRLVLERPPALACVVLGKLGHESEWEGHHSCKARICECQAEAMQVVAAFGFHSSQFRASLEAPWAACDVPAQSSAGSWVGAGASALRTACSGWYACYIWSFSPLISAACPRWSFCNCAVESWKCLAACVAALGHCKMGLFPLKYENL